MVVKNVTLKKNGLYDVTFDNGELITVHEESIVKFRLIVGKSLTSQELKTLKNHIGIDQAYIKAVNYISYKLRSEYDVHHYLSEDFDLETINTVIERLKNERYIDDKVFSDALMKTMLNTTIKGPKAYKEKLFMHGIDQDLINHMTEKFSQNVMPERIEKLKNKLLKNYKGSNTHFKNKFLQTLMQKGYDKHHLEMVNLENIVDDDQFLQKDFDKMLNKYQRRYSGFELKQKLIQALMRKGYHYGDVEQLIGECNNGTFQSDDEI